ncbi:amidophosphoribosyltransferase [Plantactinospora soyae]|uniref:Amidophosphoribosyltransferase n=1 Tax=Plantactinospora soyae TaxID=1544732 RepID=A0A927R0C6_9ACTN|nr:amidophosphoribosyltransferase [Plantactinospora soyae]MBE1488503.1 amidophosphoribosyltransferase [Plantactinospora soyae]
MGDGGDVIKEACGVFGVRAPEQPVSHITYLGLYALQHRGQESAGMAVSEGTKIWVNKDMGLVSTVFDHHRLEALRGHLAIGHTRYSTTGASAWQNAQPSYRTAQEVQFALAHNGNLVNTPELAQELGLAPGTVGSDSDLVAEHLIAELAAPDALGDADPLERALARVLPRLRGAFSFVIMDEDRLIGVRDPNGFRPLFLGQLPQGWVLASETPALDVVGAKVVREVEPGEMVVIDASGVRSVRPFPSATINPTLCSFEFVYFARPDGVLRGQGVHGARKRMGMQLAVQAPVDADLVVPVPESGIPGAQGFAQQSGIPYGDGWIKNRYIGRTFIAPTQELRDNAVRIKLNPIIENVAGQRLVVVEDSIIRATTLRGTMRMLREAGATAIHLRICSPPYRWPCFYGMDTGDRSTLIAANLDVDAIRDYLGVDSLVYLELDRMLGAISDEPNDFCTACMTGDYPVPVSVNTTKDMLERA